MDAKETMKTALKIIGVLGLLMTVVAPVFYLMNMIQLDLNHQLMLAGMLLWFVTAIPNTSNTTN